MEDLGKEMVRHCAGLPLSVIVLGGILATKKSTSEWQMVSKNVKSYLKGGKDVLALSYDDLPPYLKPCFLYLSVFPEDYEIRAERLIRLWVAEGIVSSEGNGEEMMEEDVAEGCLVELVERCMVQVGKRGPTLKIKTCRMHDLMRDLCLSIAKKENFVYIIEDPSFSPSISRAVRRIAAHQSIPIWCTKSSLLRSILFFDDPTDLDVLAKAVLNPKLFRYHECSDMLTPVLFAFLLWKLHGSWGYLLSKFKLLRVVNFEVSGDLIGIKLQSAIGDLIHLRFLCLGCIEWYYPRIPSSLGNLRCLQSLDLRMGGDNYYLPNVIWKLEQLRHLYLPQPGQMSGKTKLKLQTLTNLLTLVNFKTDNCFVADLSKFTKLRKLKIYVSLNIELLTEPIITSKYLHSLSISDCSEEGLIDQKLIQNLLSSCVNVCELKLLRVKMKELQEYHHFSSNIAYIRLIDCELEEDPMPTLEKLPNLRILVLDYHAFNGKEMVCSAPRFPKLESLSLIELEQLEEWKVEEGAMPALRHLEIIKCRYLKMLPDGLRFITTLQELKIQYMPNGFKDKLVQ